jgi:hypothetical protein
MQLLAYFQVVCGQTTDDWRGLMMASSRTLALSPASGGTLRGLHADCIRVKASGAYAFHAISSPRWRVRAVFGMTHF